MSDLEKARVRLIELNTREFLVGQANQADLDEMQHLAKLLDGQIPAKVGELISNWSFKPAKNSQINLGERIARAFYVEEMFGRLPSVIGSGLDTETPVFSLNDDDKKRVTKLCSDMRKIVFASPDFDEPHKKRLLNRIAAIEKEVLSERGMFDVILGGVSDIGETLGKFGKDIKPLTDRMSEVTKITRAATKAYDQLPSPEEIKSLPAPDGDETD